MRVSDLLANTALGLCIRDCAIEREVPFSVSEIASHVQQHDLRNDHSRAQLPGTFMDSIYGHLVNDEEVVSMKLAKLEAGELGLSSDMNIEANSEHSTEPILDPYRLPNTYPESYYKASSKFLHNKVQYPDNDDVDDINTGSPMFGGFVTFANLPAVNCFDPALSQKFDIAIVGAGFDTGVSFRPGARFGPNALRQSSIRLSHGWNSVRGRTGSKLRDLDPYHAGLKIVDCGDVPMSPFDNRIALNQLYRGERIIHKHSISNATLYKAPRIITLGGDHTITLANIRSAYETFGKITVVHFDSHIDTWNPNVLGGDVSHYAGLNHGTFLHYAAEAGYINNKTSTHVGIRAPYISKNDVKHDIECGFRIISARDIDEFGMYGIAEQIKKNVGDTPVYISLDIDVLDPAVAPGTGTAEPGGFTSRELLTILDALEGINLVGADIVEVSPPYDTNAGITSLAAVHSVDSFIGLMVVQEV